MAFNAFNAPFWDFFDNINDEVDQFNRLLSSNGYEDRVKVSPANKAITNSGANNSSSDLTKRDRPANRSIFPSFFNSPLIASNGLNIVPPVDILDNDDNYELHVSVPGAEKDKIDLDFNPEKNEVTISGQIPGHGDDSDSKLKVNERSSGKFERHISLPASPKLDEGNIKANYSNGVLTVKIPKLSQEKSSSRRIAISSSETWTSETPSDEKATDDKKSQEKK